MHTIDNPDIEPKSLLDEVTNILACLGIGLKGKALTASTTKLPFSKNLETEVSSRQDIDSFLVLFLL